jgi:Chromo (CHRromatin Organisation MOdifier) domain
VPKYLVKWRNLSYRDCTWETSESVSDDAVIAKYHAVNTPPPDEAPLWRDEIWKELNPKAHARVVSSTASTQQ